MLLRPHALGRVPESIAQHIPDPSTALLRSTLLGASSNAAFIPPSAVPTRGNNHDTMIIMMGEIKGIMKHEANEHNSQHKRATESSVMPCHATLGLCWYARLTNEITLLTCALNWEGLGNCDRQKGPTHPTKRSSLAVQVHKSSISRAR